MFSGRKRSGARAIAGPQNAALNLHYTGQPPVNVRGPVTGSAYTFSSVQPVQPVDPRDAKFLLASPLFSLSK
jgi:hypothetical protein